MRKRMLSILLSVCMIFTMIPTAAFATETNTQVTIGDGEVSTAVTAEGEPANPDAPSQPTVGEEPTKDEPTNTEVPPKACTCDPVIEGEGVHTNAECPLYVDTEVPTKTCICDPVIEGEGVHTNEDCPLYVIPAECNCKTICSAESINTECPVCSKEGADLAECKGEAVMMTPMSTNSGLKVTTDVTDGYTYDGKYLNITKAGTYTISGTTATITSYIVVNVTGDVIVNLDGVNLEAPVGANGFLIKNGNVTLNEISASTITGAASTTVIPSMDGLKVNSSAVVAVNGGTFIGGEGEYSKAISGKYTIANGYGAYDKDDKLIKNSDLFMATYIKISPLPHTHCVCGGSVNVSDHTTHSDITYTAIGTDFVGGDLEGNIYLDRDVTLTSTLTVESGKTLNLCLNGYKLDANGGNFSVITNNGTLSVCDCSTGLRYGQWNSDQTVYTITNTQPQSGTYDTLTAGIITGANKTGDWQYGGGVFNKGKFNLYSGSITGNRISRGGGVASNSGSFTMYGGSITGNIAEYGGGVYNNSTFNMYDGNINHNAAYMGGGMQNYKIFSLSGGNITGNTSSVYAGVHIGDFSEEFNLSGSPTITGNTANGKASNVGLSNEKTINIDDTLTNTTPIGITTATAPVAGTPVNITGNNSADYSKYFTSDNSAYEIVNTGESANQVVQLQKKVEHTANTRNETLDLSGYEDLTYYTNATETATVVKGNILTADIDASFEGWAWNSSEKNLTLSGMALTTNAAKAVCLPDGTEIVLTAGTVNTVIGGDGAVNEPIYGIDCDGDLTIDGSGTLTVTAGAAVNNFSYGISTSENLTINGGVITANGGDASGGSSFGICCDADLTINGGTVNVNGGTVTGDFNTSYGILAEDGEIVLGTGVSVSLPVGGKVSDSGITIVSSDGSIVSSATITDTAPHTHCVCGGKVNVGDHLDANHSDINYTAIPANFVGGNLEGNIYLDRNVTLTSSLAVASGKTLNLCLNGFKLSADGGNFSVITNNGTLNLCDCGTKENSVKTYDWDEQTNKWADGTPITVTGGVITGGNVLSGGSDVGGGGVNNGGIFNMYSGTIAGNRAATFGGGVHNRSLFTLYGGTIQNNGARSVNGLFNYGTGGGVYNRSHAKLYSGIITKNLAGNNGAGVFVKNGSSVYLYGNTEIYENINPAKSANLYIDRDSQILMKNTLSNTHKIGINMWTPGVFTRNDWGSQYDISQELDKFASDKSGYQIMVDGTQLKMAIKPTIIEGDKQEFPAGSTDDLTVTSSADLADFERVEVGKVGSAVSTLDEANYTKASGSTIITLKNSYLKTLSAGTYTLNIVSATGTASTTFTIKASGVGSTGGDDDDDSYNHYDIKITKEGNGAISPIGGWFGIVEVQEWRDQTFTFTPDKGYVVSDVLVDGKSIGAKASYSFKDVTKDHTLKVIFKASTNGHVNPQTGVDVSQHDVIKTVNKIDVWLKKFHELLREEN